MWPVLVPTLGSFLSMRAALILLPLYVLDRGYGPTLAGFIISLRGVGMLGMDVPAGFLVARLGNKLGMISGHILAAMALFLFALFDHPAVFVLGALLSGAAFAIMMVARLSYVGEKCEISERGRIIAFMAGLQRLGGIAGPIGGGLIATSFGFVPALTVLGLIALLAALVVMIFCESDPEVAGPRHVSHEFIATLRANRNVFLTSGIGAVGLMSLRGASPLLITLFGNALGLSAAQIGIFASVTTILEFVMFLPAGYIMDRFGRKCTLIPGTFIMAASLFVMVFVASFQGYIAGILLMALGNGLATGVIMSIASDLAPDEYRGQFLGVWRFIADIGFTGGPLFVTGIMGLVGLGASAVVLGSVASCFAAAMWLFAPESMSDRKVATGSARK